MGGRKEGRGTLCSEVRGHTRVPSAPLPQQQSTFRLADPPFPVTRMAFPFFDVPVVAGAWLPRKEPLGSGGR